MHFITNPNCFLLLLHCTAQSIAYNKLYIVKSELMNMTQAWDKEKNLSTWQESNPWPPEHQAGTLSNELRGLMESKVN